MNVYFEGPNGSGKSTIADAVKNALRWDQINLHHKTGDQFCRYLSEYRRTNTVFVRAHWSEQIYSSLYNRPTPFTQLETNCLNQVARLRGIIVLCLPRTSEVLCERLLKRKATGLDTDKQSSIALCNQEWDMWSNLFDTPNVPLDYIYRSSDEGDLHNSVTKIVQLVKWMEALMKTTVARDEATDLVRKIREQ